MPSTGHAFSAEAGEDLGMRRARLQQLLNVSRSFRAEVPATSIEWKHRQFQADLFEHLLLNLPSNYSVELESGGVDILIISPTRLVVIEVKSGSSAIGNLREALGQSLEYVYRRSMPGSTRRAQIVVYGPSGGVTEHLPYLRFIQSVLAIDLDYCSLGDHQAVLLAVMRGDAPKANGDRAPASPC